jgi:hypothetical protein
MGTGASFPGVKRPGCEADHSPPTNAEVKKNVDLYFHSLIRLHGLVLYLLSTGKTLPFIKDVYLWFLVGTALVS